MIEINFRFIFNKTYVLPDGEKIVRSEEMIVCTSSESTAMTRVPFEYLQEQDLKFRLTIPI